MYRELQKLYTRIIEEAVVADDFLDYASVDFPEVVTDGEDEKYSHIRPNLDKISLKEYNRRQIEFLMDYVRSKLNVYKDITNEELHDFVKKLIQSNPAVLKKARLHFAAIEPDLFDYTDH